jgi:putative ABC transport system ATP-binding protein
MLLKTKNLRKQFAGGAGTVDALRGIDLQIHAGEFVTVVGPSGSGKSTLLTIFGLLDEPSDGTVYLEGTDIEQYRARERTQVRKQTIGFVFQDYGLIPTLTALENVAAPRLLDSDPAATEARAAELLDRVGLGSRLNHYPDELSGGQKQRVSVARALVNEPALVLADEPTGNLDRDTGERVFEELLAVTGDDVTIVAVTHDEYLAEFSDRVLRLIDGTLDRGTHGENSAGTTPETPPDTAGDQS